jgi:hypothetical protein
MTLEETESYQSSIATQLAGNGKFRGLSFGISFEEAKSFLAAGGVIARAASRSPRRPEERIETLNQ